MSLEARPLLPEELSLGAAKICGPKAPLPMKMMAAKGFAPGAGADDLVVSLYQLSFDENAQVSETARKSLSELPDQVLAGCLDKPLPALVLDRLAHVVKDRSGLVEKILLNNAVSDETFAWLAKLLKEREMEILASNEQRLLRHPAIIEALYVNPATRMSTANRCVELAVRNNLTLNLPAFKEIAQAIGMAPREEDPMDQALADEQMDQSFTSLYHQSRQVEEGPEEGDEASEPEERERMRKRIENMTVSEKVRLAAVGTVFHRTILLRDSNRIVCMAAIKSSQITDMEVVKVSKNPQVPEEILRYISRQGEWVKLYQVKANLVTNPKTPLSISLSFLSHLRTKELRLLARSKNIAAALRAAAQSRLAQQIKRGG